MDEHRATRSVFLGCLIAAAACVFGACAFGSLAVWVAWTAVSNIRIELPDGDEFAATVAVEMFKAMDRDQKLGTLRGLPDHPDAAAAVPLLTAALDDPDAEVRATAAEALWLIDPVAAERVGAP